MPNSGRESGQNEAEKSQNYPLAKEKTQNFFPVGWSPDGSAIYVMYHPGHPKNTIWSLPAGGGFPKTVFIMPGNVTSASVRPDGKKCVCSLLDSKSDVWVVENFDPTNRK
jgi:hypothetical protein